MAINTRQPFDQAVTDKKAVASLDLSVHFLEQSNERLAEIISMSQDDVEAEAKKARDLASHLDAGRQRWFRSIEKEIAELRNPDPKDVERRQKELAAHKTSHERNLTITGDEWRRGELSLIQHNIDTATKQIKAATTHRENRPFQALQ